jgi:hypothetical protein
MSTEQVLGMGMAGRIRDAASHRAACRKSRETHRIGVREVESRHAVVLDSPHLQGQTSGT